MGNIHINIIMGIPWDRTGINCYMMGQTNMSHGQSWPKGFRSFTILVLQCVITICTSFLHLFK